MAWFTSTAAKPSLNQRIAVKLSHWKDRFCKQAKGPKPELNNIDKAKMLHSQLVHGGPGKTERGLGGYANHYYRDGTYSHSDRG